jgi:hypothetical protein
MRFIRLIISIINLFCMPTAIAIGFQDIDLARTIKKNPSGIIYIWSPGMPLSEKGLLELEAITKPNKIHLTTLIDPQSSQFITKEFDLDQNHKKALANKLQRLGALNHFPAIIFYKDGKIITPILHGYEAPQGMKKFIQEHLQVKFDEI